MHELQLLLRGALAGLAISAPVGPVNVLCMSITLTKSRTAGVLAGIGAAAADTIYGSIAGFGISVIIGWLLREEFWIRLVGGMLLICIGIVYYLKKPQSLREKRAEPAHSAVVSTFLLNLTNPTTILSFLAVLATLGLAEHRPAALTLFLIAGIFGGSMLWWIILALAAGHFRDRFTDRSVVWMNRIAAFAIGGFGLVTMFLARK